MAVVKSPKNKKHKHDWVKSLNRLNKPLALKANYPLQKKHLYNNSKLNEYFRINWKLNNVALWKIALWKL